MGLTPGTEVSLRKTAPMGDPIQLELRGYELTLRLAEAAKIEITEIETIPEEPCEEKPGITGRTGSENRLQRGRQSHLRWPVIRTVERQHFLIN